MILTKTDRPINIFDLATLIVPHDVQGWDAELHQHLCWLARGGAPFNHVVVSFGVSGNWADIIAIIAAAAKHLGLAGYLPSHCDPDDQAGCIEVEFWRPAMRRSILHLAVCHTTFLTSGDALDFLEELEVLAVHPDPAAWLPLSVNCEQQGLEPLQELASAALDAGVDCVMTSDWYEVDGLMYVDLEFCKLPGGCA